jgi:hypothetical protein
MTKALSPDSKMSIQIILRIGNTTGKCVPKDMTYRVSSPF